MELEVDDISYNSVFIQAKINSRANKLLSESADRSGRTKTQEAKLRLLDHLERFQSISELKKTFDRN